MLIRSVRMTFKPEKVEEFKEIFQNSKNHIRAFRGCNYLELHRDYIHENIFATYSIWEDQASLDEYRNSDLFKDVWSRTKALFDKQPIAFSSKLVERVEI